MTGAEPVWIELRDVLTLHDRLLAFHGGAQGVRDEGLLQSALARAKQRAAHDDSADLIDMATAYTAGIIKNHPFADGNKRTGFVTGILFLELNGFRFTATESAAAEAVVALAAGALDEAGYSQFLRGNVIHV
ncbi:MAG: type II toxin-antitoxin system death-on-curing family toxin [Pseudomonadota bacterium]|nr:type II toxin-antitoxin system death-on-curing family toxin [Pseudomonadota bacterium]